MKLVTLLIFINFFLMSAVQAQDGYDSHLRRNESLAEEARIKETFFQNYSCEEFDLYPETNQDFRHQGQTGFCWAYALSDLISFKTHVRVSAIDIALNYIYQSKLNYIANNYLFLGSLFSVHSTQNTFLGGVSAKSMENNLARIQDKGVCLESDFIYSYKNDPDVFKNLEDLREDFLSSESEVVFAQNSSWIKSLFPNVNLKDLQFAASQSQDYDFVHKIAMTTCRRIHINNLPIQIHTRSWDIWNSVKQSLESQ